MGIRKKYRRKLIIGERLFLWWVARFNQRTGVAQC
jgi:hypothetical protein